MPVKKDSRIADQPQESEKNNDPAYWRKWYVAVVVFLIAQVIFYFFITQHFK